MFMEKQDDFVYTAHTQFISLDGDNLTVFIGRGELLSAFEIINVCRSKSS